MAASRNASPPGRTCRWMSAIAAVSLRRGSTTISERAGSAAIAFSVGRGGGEARRHPGVLADEHGHLGVLEVRRSVGDVAEQVGVDPDLARLLLGQRVGR